MTQAAYGYQNQTGIGQQAISITQAPTSNLAQQQTMVRSAIERMQSHNSSLSETIIRLRDTIDRLIGGEGADSAKNGPTPVPNGDIQALHHEIEGYEHMLALLHYQFTRLAGV
jgi:hypothetical protein